MTGRSLPRGAAPVGYLNELPAIEATAVRYLRMWFDGPAHQDVVWNDIASGLGPHEGRIALRTLEELLALIATRGRRPLMRHPVHCKCFGADEAAFANLIGAAKEGAEQDALLFAALLVDGQRAISAMRLAGRFAASLGYLVAQEPPSDLATKRQIKPISNRLH